MSSVDAVPDLSVAAPGPLTALRRMLRHPGAVFGIVVIAVEVLAAVFAPLLAPHDPLHTYQDYVLSPPSGRFVLGDRPVTARLFVVDVPTRTSVVPASRNTS